jgi:hypothetical protein
MQQGDIRYISLTVLEDTDIPVEKFVLEIRSILQSVSGIPSDVILESESTCTLADLQQYLRACLIKLNSYRFNKLNTENRTFSLSIEKIEGGLPKQSKENVDNYIDWIPADTHYNWKAIKPLKSVELDLLRVSIAYICQKECYV